MLVWFLGPNPKNGPRLAARACGTQLRTLPGGPRLSPTESADHELITQEALDLLQAVRDGQPVSRDRAEQFARAVLDSTPSADSRSACSTAGCSRARGWSSWGL
ncbi:MAG TPA: hypothetical protein VI197_12070 [Polyangiaceae bacterium]